MYVCAWSVHPLLHAPKLPSSCDLTNINLPIRKSLLQVLIDSLIRDLADQRKIRHTHFLLLCAFEHGLANLPLGAACRGGRGVLVATCALCYRLVRIGMSAGAPEEVVVVEDGVIVLP